MGKKKLRLTRQKQQKLDWYFKEYNITTLEEAKEIIRKGDKLLKRVLEKEIGIILEDEDE